MSSKWSDAHVSLNPLRMLRHIQSDTEWKQTTAETLLKSNTEEWANPSGSKTLDVDDGDEDLTVKKLMQEIEKTKQKEIWKEKGRLRLLSMINNETEPEQVVYGIGAPPHHNN